MHRVVKLLIAVYLCSISMIFLLPTENVSDSVGLENQSIILSRKGRDLKEEVPESPSIALVDKNRDKIHDDLAIKMLQYKPDESIEVIVSFEQPPTQEEFCAIEAMGGTILQVYSIIPACCVRIPRKTVPKLSSIHSVCIIEGLASCKLMMIDSTRQARERPFVWDRGYQGDPNTAVAIIDSGIDATHPDLAGKVIYWHDFSADASPTPLDFYEHGTHCASIAAGTGVHSNGQYFQETYGNMTWSASGSRNYYPTKIYSVGYLTLSITWDNAIIGNTPYLKLGVRNASMTEMSMEFSTSPYTWTTTMPLFPGTYDIIVENYNSTESRKYVISAKIPAGNTGDNYPEHLRGAAPGSKIVALKAFTNDGGSSLSWLMAALDWVHLNYRNYNITVVSMSWGIGIPYDTVDSAVDNLVLIDGVVAVASAGNDGPGYLIGSPASASACIAVGAVNKANQITTYSSNGNWEYNPTGKPDIVAPGGSVSSSGLAPNQKILAADSSYSDMAGIDYDTYEMLRQPDPYPGGYQQMAGTSMAGPHVAGIVQLLINAWPGGWNWDPTDAKKIKQILCMSGIEVAGAETSYQMPPLERGIKDCVEGWGKVNADAALNLTRDNLQIHNSYAFQFGNRPTDLKNFGGRVYLEAGRRYNFTLSFSSVCDADLYLWAPNPSGSGDPILFSSSTSAILGQYEQIIVRANVTGYYYLTAKLISGPLISAANLYLNDLISIVVQNPVPGSIFSDANCIPLNITIYGTSGMIYDTAWYSFDAENYVFFTGNVCISLPRGFHEVFFFANDSMGEEVLDPILFTVKSAHPEDHVTLTITKPSNGASLTDIQKIKLGTVFTTDLGSLVACWYILDYDPPRRFSGNTTLYLGLGVHRIIVYANNTLGEEVASQEIKFTTSKSVEMDLWIYILLALVGFAFGAIAIGIHHFLGKPPPRPTKRSIPVFPAQPEPKFSLAKASTLASRPPSTTSLQEIKPPPQISEQLSSKSLINQSVPSAEIPMRVAKSPAISTPITPSQPLPIQPNIPPGTPTAPIALNTNVMRLLKLLPPSPKSEVNKDTQILEGEKVPSMNLAPNQIRCPQCGENLTSGIKTCPFCKWIF